MIPKLFAKASELLSTLFHPYSVRAAKIHSYEIKKFTLSPFCLNESLQLQPLLL